MVLAVALRWAGGVWAAAAAGDEEAAAPAAAVAVAAACCCCCQRQQQPIQIEWLQLHPAEQTLSALLCCHHQEAS